MLDTSKSDREFYESQDKEQLIIFLLNDKRENERLHKKLEMLTGCSCYGDCDGTDGTCVDCYYDNPDLQIRCSQFQGEFTRRLSSEYESK